MVDSPGSPLQPPIKGEFHRERCHCQTQTSPHSDFSDGCCKPFVLVWPGCSFMALFLPRFRRRCINCGVWRHDVGMERIQAAKEPCPPDSNRSDTGSVRAVPILPQSDVPWNGVDVAGAIPLLGFTFLLSSAGLLFRDHSSHFHTL